MIVMTPNYHEHSREEKYIFCCFFGQTVFMWYFCILNPSFENLVCTPYIGDTSKIPTYNVRCICLVERVRQMPLWKSKAFACSRYFNNVQTYLPYSLLTKWAKHD